MFSSILFTILDLFFSIVYAFSSAAFLGWALGGVRALFMNELRWSGFSIMLVSSILPLVIAVVFYYFGNWIGVKFYNTPFTGILNFWQIILIPLFFLGVTGGMVSSMKERVGEAKSEGLQ